MALFGTVLACRCTHSRTFWQQLIDTVPKAGCLQSCAESGCIGGIEAAVIIACRRLMPQAAAILKRYQQLPSTRSLPMLLRERACQVQEETRTPAGGVAVFAAFVAVLIGLFAVMNALPAVGLSAALLQEAVLALLAVVAVRLAAPDTLKRCTCIVQQRNLIRFAVGSLVLVGFVGGAISFATWNIDNAGAANGLAFSQLPSASEIAQNLLLLLGICLLTGLYEESFMRVLGIEAFERAFGQGRAASGCAIGERDACSAASEHVAGGCSAHPVASGYVAGGRVGVSGEIEHNTVKLSIAFNPAAKRAILVSALLFALLHVGVPDASADQLVLMQSVLKFVQALLFGVILGVLYAQTRRLWPCAFIHAGFDVLYLAPNVLLTGAMPATYASGTVGDTVLLAVTVLMLAGIVIKISKEIAR